MSLVCLTYVSVATRPMTDDDLIAILESARRNNQELGITGLLLYRDGYFIQALEGDRAVVDPLFDKISQDERHNHVLMVFEDDITERSYGNWSMGFRKISDALPAGLEGYSDFFQDPPSMKEQPARARLLMEAFRSGIYY